MEIKEAIKCICDAFECDSEKIIGRDTAQSVSQIRNLIFYLLHFDYGFSSNAIAKAMDRQPRHIVRQNATTKYLISNFNDYRKTYADIKAKLNT